MPMNITTEQETQIRDKVERVLRSVLKLKKGTHVSFAMDLYIDPPYITIRDSKAKFQPLEKKDKSS